MKTIAIIDTETDSLDPATGHLLEVGCVIWDVQHRATVLAESYLVRAEANAAEHINGIPAGLLVRGFPPADAHRCIMERCNDFGVDACVAYNAEFDRQWLPTLATRPASPADPMPWICAMDDLAWPRASSGGKKLVEIALAHGVGVTSAHRALTDCMILAQLFERVAEMLDAKGESTTAWLIHGLRPKAVFTNADRSYNPKANDAYKAHGFRWHLTQPCSTIPAGEKVWWRRMAVEDAKALPFAVREVRP